MHAGTVLVTGGAGFVGCNIADHLAGMGHAVRVFDNLSRPGVERNLAWLKSRHGDRIESIAADIRDEQAVDRASTGVDAVFHLAAQVAVTTSFVNPVEDFEINLRGVINLLEALRRHGGRTPIIFASTNKVYGNLADIPLGLHDDAYLPMNEHLRAHGVDEGRPLEFHTPYGCSKGAADQYVLDYARSFGLRTCVLRMSCIYGPRQMGTEDQGWVAHFLIRALASQEITIYGDGRQVRDILHVSDAVDAYLAAWRAIDAISGRPFNIGGGPQNAVSLLQLLSHVEDITGQRVRLNFHDWRPGDQRYFVADTTAVHAALRLSRPRGWRDGVADLVHWLASQQTLHPARDVAA